MNIRRSSIHRTEAGDLEIVRLICPTHGDQEAASLRLESDPTDLAHASFALRCYRCGSPVRVTISPTLSMKVFMPEG